MSLVVVVVVVVVVLLLLVVVVDVAMGMVFPCKIIMV